MVLQLSFLKNKYLAKIFYADINYIQLIVNSTFILKNSKVVKINTEISI